MGNRAVITTRDETIGVYLHWYGDWQHVEAFLSYCRWKEFSPPEEDCYGWAALVTVISNFCGADGYTVGIDMLKKLDCDNGDNGVYITKNWQIVGRKFVTGDEDFSESGEELLRQIDEAQPQEKFEKNLLSH